MAFTEPTTAWFSRTIDRLSIEASTFRAWRPDETPVRQATPPGREVLHGVEDERRHAGALDDDVGMGTGVLDPTGVVGGPERVDEVGLGAGRDLVEDMDVETALHADHRGQQTDGPRAR